MVSDYKNADGDYRGVLERYLPTAYKTIGNGSDVHMGLLGALKQMLVTTEQDIIDGTQQMFLANANSWALDLYGDWVGESRKGELDDTYRARIIEKITLGRSTVGNIIKGIKREINDPDLTVSVYEPWRNIFILNKSFLNGADRLMGKFYRYAVVQVTLNKYVNALELQMIADKYKSAGVMVLFTYSDSIVAVDNTLLSLNTSLAEYLSLATEIPTTDIYSLSKRFGLNSLPIQDKDLNYPLFKTNKSNINGADKLSGSPRQLFSDSYVGVPSLNIMGLVDKDTDPRNYNNPYEYIYENSKVLKGGRNLLLGTKDFSGNGNWVLNSNTSKVNDIYQGLDATQTAGTWGGPKYNNSSLASQGAITSTNDTFIMSAWVRNTGTTKNSIYFFSDDGTSLKGYKVADLPSNSGWVRVSSKPFQYTTTSGLTGSIRFEPSSDSTNGYVQQVGLKLEKGSIATDWTPAPEDNSPETYKHPYKIEDYYMVSNRPFSFGNSAASYPNFVFDISDAVIGYAKYTFDGNDFLKQFDSIDLKIGPSPYGLRSSKVIINNDESLGSWDTTLSNGDYIVDIASSTGRYNYKLSSPTDIKTFSLKDYYPSEGSYRSIYLNKKGSNPLLLARTKSQTFSDIFINDYIINRYQYLLPYIRKVTIAGTTMVNPEVYNSTTGSWDKIPSVDTDLSSYLKVSGDNPIYLLIRDNSENSTVANLGVSIEFEQQQKVVQYEVDSTPVDAHDYSINKNIGYIVDKDSPTDAYNHNVE